MGIYEVQSELEGTGTPHQKETEARGLQLNPIKSKAGCKIRSHHFILIQHHCDSYCHLKGSKMTSWCSNTGISPLRGAAPFAALTLSDLNGEGTWNSSLCVYSAFSKWFCSSRTESCIQNTFSMLLTTSESL